MFTNYKDLAFDIWSRFNQQDVPVLVVGLHYFQKSYLY